MCAADGGNVSLFGNELPIVSEYETIQPLASYPDLVSVLDEVPGLSSHASIVSAAGQLNLGGFQKTVPLFGIDPSTYFSVCTDLHIERGSAESLEEKGVL